VDRRAASKPSLGEQQHDAPLPQTRPVFWLHRYGAFTAVPDTSCGGRRPGCPLRPPARTLSRWCGWPGWRSAAESVLLHGSQARRAGKSMAGARPS